MSLAGSEGRFGATKIKRLRLLLPTTAFCLKKGTYVSMRIFMKIIGRKFFSTLTIRVVALNDIYLTDKTFPSIVYVMEALQQSLPFGMEAKGLSKRSKVCSFYAAILFLGLYI